MAILKMDTVTENNERRILREFFDTVMTIDPKDNSVSDLKIIKATQDKLKIALRGSEIRCTCAKTTWGGICETCQGSDEELWMLRNFFIQMRTVKKNNVTPNELRELMKTYKDKLVA